MPNVHILAIESSCDETAAAIVRDGEQVVSSAVASQIAAHQPFGGVVPEIASREHLRNIVPVVHRALEQAGRSYNDVDAIAVTKGPGLAGALLVGVSYAKSLSFALGKPLIAVNHLEGHIHAVLLEEKQKGAFDLRFPLMTLVVSGGHTHLYLATERENLWSYENVGHTRDDAAGEAFDKVAKLLALGYPGGPIVDALAKHGDPYAVKFTIAQMKRPNRVLQGSTHKREVFGPGPDGERSKFDFSYSGIKTAVLRYVETHEMQASIEARRRKLAEFAKPKADDVRALCDQQTIDLVASFQRAVVDDLITRTLAAAAQYEVATLFVSGGVAANSELRERFEKRAGEEGVPVYFPSRPLSTDNAAMIAAAAYPKWLAREFAPIDVSAEPTLPLR